jgi:hypothetical protein
MIVSFFLGKELPFTHRGSSVAGHKIKYKVRSVFPAGIATLREYAPFCRSGVSYFITISGNIASY